MHVNPTEGRIHLSHELRVARGKAGLTQRQVAKSLDWSISKLNRIETGQISISTTDLRALLACYGETDPQRVDGLVSVAKQSRRLDWAPYRDVLNPEYRMYLGFEATAARLWQFDLLVIPGLLQTHEYANALVRSVANPDDSDETIKRQVKIRLDRRAVLDRPQAIEANFILDESVLRRLVGRPGDPQVLHDQLRFLKEITRRPNVKIHVLPREYGSHRGLFGSFVVLQLPDPAEGVVYLENGRPSSLIRGRPDQVRRYRQLFDELVQGSSKDADEFCTVIDAAMAGLPT